MTQNEKTKLEVVIMKHGIRKRWIVLIICSLIIGGMTDYSQLRLSKSIVLDNHLLISSTIEKTIIEQGISVNYLRIPKNKGKYIPHDPIVIFNNENLTDYGFPGSGTEEDPYRIEGYNITSSHTGIKIFNTTKHILIQNCYIRGYSAIRVENTSYGTIIIRNNLCENASIYLICITHSDGAIISSNYCYRSAYPCYCIGASYSKDVKISDNIVDGKNVYAPGIRCFRTENVTVKGNICMNNENAGIYFDEVINGTIKNNICTDNLPTGIALWSSKNIVIANNTFTNLHSFVDKLYLDKIVGNKVSNIFGLILQNFYVINSEKYGGGIEMLDNSSNITIIHNVCLNMCCGIYLARNNNSVLVIDNYISQCYAGVGLYSVNNSVISHNTLVSNSHCGVHIMNGNNNAISYNTLVGNYYGVYIAVEHRYTHGKNVTFLSYNNTIHHNNFTNNVPDNGTSQAYDAGVNNTWYDPQTLEGNYWSDWNGTGVYPIDGPANSFDFYPLPRPRNSLFHYWWFDLSLLLSSFVLIFSIFIAFHHLKIFQH